MAASAFLPTTLEEIKQRGWDALDVVLVSGDSYIDSPYIGTAVIGRVLEKAGYRVGIIAQPNIASPDDITRLGEPRLFWGVTGGSVDSMVANYTASRRKRRKDDYTPGGVNDRRPNRAVIAYTNLIQRFFKGTAPIVLGGIEASLRRVAHYDFWDDAIRRSILFDAKADYLLYGMAERSVVQLADALKKRDIFIDTIQMVCKQVNLLISYLNLIKLILFTSITLVFLRFLPSFCDKNQQSSSFQQLL